MIYLKNGSVIYGMIIEQKPGEYYKIKSGMNIFVYDVDEIDIIKKEIIEYDPMYQEFYKQNQPTKYWPSSMQIKSSLINFPYG